MVRDLFFCLFKLIRLQIIDLDLDNAFIVITVSFKDKSHRKMTNDKEFRSLASCKMVNLFLFIFLQQNQKL